MPVKLVYRGKEHEMNPGSTVRDAVRKIGLQPETVLAVVEGNLNLPPQRPQLPSLCEWLFSATRRKVPSCASDPRIQATFGLIVVHG